MSVNRCMVPECGAFVPRATARPYCRRHWHHLPEVWRQRVRDSLAASNLSGDPRESLSLSALGAVMLASFEGTFVPADAETPQQTCRSCKAPIFWARTRKGSLMPINAEPDPQGNAILGPLQEGDWRQTVDILTPIELLAFAPGDRYMPHHATCPDAERWRWGKA